MQSHVAAFFRVELAREYIVLLHRGMDMGAVFCGRLYDFFIFRLQIIGMNEVYISAFSDPPEQPSVVFKMQGIPAHMRDL